jgi:small redox-active disulfide protein 2
MLETQGEKHGASLERSAPQGQGRERNRRRRRTNRRRQNMKIKVLGTGCAKCKLLYAEAQKAIASSGMAVDLEKVEKIDDIMKYGVMMTPALVIDDQVKASGRIPPAADIVSWIMTAATSAPE